MRLHQSRWRERDRFDEAAEPPTLTTKQPKIGEPALLVALEELGLLPLQGVSLCAWVVVRDACQRDLHLDESRARVVSACPEAPRELEP
ncbi:MAG TPA: hypothetical protein VM925_03470 [Labilithrix sp.]|nr:hypothetical protein [Labilithrix sp.]